MAQPPAYNREKNFTLNSGRETDHSALNAELDRASNSINDIRANLALMQADDGKIRASSITTDSLDQEVLDYVQEKALAGANAVADAATAIANSANEKADQAIQTANASNEIAGNADNKADFAVETANAASANADTAINAANAANETALEANGNADTAVTTASLADTKSDEAIRIANAANETAGNANSKSDTAVETANSASKKAQTASAHATTAVNTANSADGKADQALAETAQIDTKVEAAVNEAISGVTIPGLTSATIAGALGYTPYDAETNSKDFATSAEVGQAIQQAVDAIPEQVNADWNATEGPGEILNKPGDFSGATADSAGEQGLVPAPGAGDQAKYLNGAGDWVEISNATNEKAGLARPDGETVTVDENGVFSALAPIGTVYVQFSGQTAPADLYGGTWENISAQFAGMFFRAEGGNSAAFGSTQSDGAPNIIGTAGWSVGGNASWGPNFSGALSASRSGTGMTRAESGAGDITISIDANRSNSKYGSATEFRPYNSTIRIWKRTA